MPTYHIVIIVITWILNMKELVLLVYRLPVSVWLKPKVSPYR